MAESSWPTGGAGTRTVNEDQYEILSTLWSEDGLEGSPADTALIYGDSSGRQVKVRASRYAQIRGWGWTSGTSDFIKSVTANSSGSTRIDLVVLRLNRTAYTVTVEVIAGTPGAGTPPALTRTTGTTGTFDIPLATVTVVNGAATISAGDVTDVAPRVGFPQPIYAPTEAALARYTWVTHGQPARVWTGGSWRDYVYTTSGWWPEPWRAAVYRTTDQTFTISTEIAVSWTSQAAYNPTGVWSAGSPTRITFPTAGTYRMEFRASANMTTGGALCWFRPNGSGVTRYGSHPCPAGTWGTRIGTAYEGVFAATNYVEAVVFQSASSSSPVLLGANDMQLWVDQIA